MCIKQHIVTYHQHQQPGRTASMITEDAHIIYIYVLFFPGKFLIIGVMQLFLVRIRSGILPRTPYTPIFLGRLTTGRGPIQFFYFNSHVRVFNALPER